MERQKKTNNIRDSFEGVYLLEHRLKDSFTQDGIRFLENEQTKKIISYSCRLSYRKNMYKFKHLGLEIEDLQSVANCLSITFFSKYMKNFKTEKQAYYALARFLGQKLYHYMTLSNKKMKPVLEIDETADLYRPEVISSLRSEKFKRVDLNQTPRTIGYQAPETEKLQIFEKLNKVLTDAQLEKMAALISKKNVMATSIRGFILKSVFDIETEENFIKSNLSKKEISQIKRKCVYTNSPVVKKIGKRIQTYYYLQSKKVRV